MAAPESTHFRFAQFHEAFLAAHQPELEGSCQAAVLHQNSAAFYGPIAMGGYVVCCIPGPETSSFLLPVAGERVREPLWRYLVLNGMLAGACLLIPVAAVFAIVLFPLVLLMTWIGTAFMRGWCGRSPLAIGLGWILSISMLFCLFFS